MAHTTRGTAPRPVALLRHLASAGLALLLTATVVGQADAGGAARGPVVEHRLDLVSATRADRVEKVLRTARRQTGDRYRYGAAGPDHFDCSGLVYFATHRAGFRKVPRTSSAQGRYMHRVKRKNLRRGDFLFFTGGSGVYHVGIYVGRRHGHRVVLHAARPGTRVRVERVWTNSWFGGTLRR